MERSRKDVALHILTAIAVLALLSYLIFGVGLAMLELPYWRMIAGTLLVVSGFVGVLASGKKADEFDQLPNQPTNTPREQMPPLPRLLDSKTTNDA